MDRFPLDLTRTRRVYYRDSFGDPRGGGTRPHAGQDIATPIGTPILAPVRARVIHSMLVNERACGFGVVLEVSPRTTPRERWTLCHFNAQPLVFDRELVEPGEPLGVVGATGNATWTDRHGRVHSSPHLHIARTRLVNGVWQPVNIFHELLDAQARDMGHAPIERAPEPSRTTPPRGARAPQAAGSFFAAFAMLAAWRASRARKGTQ